jgi:nucleoside-diphosphate-sugar epimerase
MKNKILVTGGAGYVGTALIPKLLDKGYEVTVFDNLMVGGNQLLPFFNKRNFRFVKGDIRDYNALKAVVEANDIIIHLAAIVGFPACRLNPELAKEVNIDGTVNLIKACGPNKPILYGSTGSNYGSVTNICTEETPLNPLSLYGETKTQAEKLLVDRGNTIAYRFATAFGVSPRLRLDLLINDFTNKCLRDGYLVVYEKNFMRTFIHVSDIAESFLFGIDNWIGNKTNAFIHFEDIGSDADKRNYIVSYDKINQLGFDVKVSLEEGIDEIYKALKVIDFNDVYTNAKYF